MKEKEKKEKKINLNKILFSSYVLYNMPAKRKNNKKTPEHLKKYAEPWRKLVDLVVKQHPELSFKESLQLAKKIKDQHGYPEHIRAGLSLGDVWEGTKKYGPYALGALAAFNTANSLIDEYAPSFRHQE